MQREPQKLTTLGIHVGTTYLNLRFCGVRGAIVCTFSGGKVYLHRRTTPGYVLLHKHTQ